MSFCISCAETQSSAPIAWLADEYPPNAKAKIIRVRKNFMRPTITFNHFIFKKLFGYAAALWSRHAIIPPSRLNALIPRLARYAA